MSVALLRTREISDGEEVKPGQEIVCQRLIIIAGKGFAVNVFNIERTVIKPSVSNGEH